MIAFHFLRSAVRALWVWRKAGLVAGLCGPAFVQAQTITAAPVGATAVPADHPLAMLLLALGLCAGVAWGLRQQKRIVRVMAGSSVVLAAALLGGWGDAVQAQLVALQRAFTVANGQTVAIPVQAVGPANNITGFTPVEYTNQTLATLRISSITAPTWSACFPMGAPQVPPASAALPGTRCAVGIALVANGMCWVDVAQMCADAAGAVQGTNPSQLVADTASVNAGATVTGNVLANDADADGPLQVASYTLAGATYPAGQAANVPGVGSFIVQSDGAYSFTAAATHAGGVLGVGYTTHTGASSTLSISVAAASNQAPNALNDGPYVVGMNGSLLTPITSLRANDSDPEGQALTLVSVQSPVNGFVAISGSNVVFTPQANYEGTASYTYTVADPHNASSTATVNLMVGSATAPSLVVLKSLVALAHGTGGVSVPFLIITALVDTDGSESLSIRISGVPTSLSFNAGTDLGGGVWQMGIADLSSLRLNLPGSYTTNATNLTVQVTATEANGGAAVSVANLVTLKAAYTTADVTTTVNGGYPGNSASEFIQGGSGDNTIDAGNGNNMVFGDGGADNLSAGAGSDVLEGGPGDDTLHGGSGTDVLVGGPGNDSLTGGDPGENFVDVFAWRLGDQGAAGAPAVDEIFNFSTSAAGTNTVGGDVLNLRGLLLGAAVGPNNGAGNLADYLHFEIVSDDTLIRISHTGSFAGDAHMVGGTYSAGAETQTIVLRGVNLQTYYSGATTDQQIITFLLNNNKLITP